MTQIKGFDEISEAEMMGIDGGNFVKDLLIGIGVGEVVRVVSETIMNTVTNTAQTASRHMQNQDFVG